MSSPLDNHTLLGPDGRPIGVFVPVAEWERLKAENERLKAEAADADRAREERLNLLERELVNWTPTPATPEEMEEAARLGDNSHEIRAIVARMYRTAGGGDGNR